MDIFQGWERREEETLMPPGFRFHPTDEELITHYLLKKVLDSNFSCRAIAQVDLNKSEPWELPEKAKMGEKEWFFFTLRDRKYPTGLRTNRATEAGYWKATGKDREIHSSKTCALLGMKKTLVFYKGRAPKGVKSSWVMHEYRLYGKFSYHFISSCSKDEWVICRVFQKTAGGGGSGSGGNGDRKTKIASTVNFRADFPGSPSSAVSLPPLLDSTTTEHVSCFSNTSADVSFPMSLAVPRPLPPPLQHTDGMAFASTFIAGNPVNVGGSHNSDIPFISNLLPPLPPAFNWPVVVSDEYVKAEYDPSWN